MEDKEIQDFIKKGCLWLVLIIVFFNSFYTISAGYRGVLLTFGKPTMEAQGEGFHLKMPFIQKVIKYEVRNRKVEALADSASRDLQDVQTTIALIFHLSPESVPRIHTEIGKDYGNRVIAPTIQESVKAATAKFTAEELITRRPEVRNEIKTIVSDKLAKYNVVVDDFNIVNFQFSAEFDKAIESKVTAEQLKLKAERDLERIKIEKEQIITTAEAQAEALKLQKQEITKDLIELRKVENEKLAIEKWDGILPKVTGGMPFLDVTSQLGE